MKIVEPSAIFKSHGLDEHDLTEIDQNPHYVRSVTEVGEQNEVVAQEDIYAANGMKLLAKGAKIDRSKLQRLTEHKLKVPLDLLLVAADSVDVIALARDMDRLIASDPLLTAMARSSGDPQGYKSMLGRMALPSPVAFRLTIMRDDRADLYQHSLRTTIIAHSLGLQMGLSEENLQHLFLASLCHDFGEMHTNPAILVASRAIENSERRFIYVHPITGYVVLQEMKVVPIEVMQAVLQHHERLDGSGYPHGESGKKISIPARAIAIAETLEAVVRRFNADRLNLVFRINQGRFDAAGVMALYELLPAHLQRDSETVIDSGHNQRLERLSLVLQTWPSLLKEIETNQQNAPLKFLIDRMSTLRSLAFQAGLAPELLEFLDLEGDDASLVRELNIALDEMDRLLDGLIFEIDRRIFVDAPCRAMANSILELLYAR